MKKLISPIVLTLALVATGLGCASKKAAAVEGPIINDSVTDVDVAPMPPQEPEMAYSGTLDVAAPAPAVETPVVTEAPAAAENAAASTYTVKRGDTLFSIAREVYGNGGQWQRIASANPGLSPSSLKAGTTIAIP